MAKRKRSKIDDVDVSKDGVDEEKEDVETKNDNGTHKVKEIEKKVTFK